MFLVRAVAVQRLLDDNCPPLAVLQK